MFIIYFHINNHSFSIQYYPHTYKCPFEIIQIGAIKFNETLETIGTLDVFVKPEIYTRLNPFVKEITGLTALDLEKGVSFKEMYTQLLEFITAEDSVLCVWGLADIKELLRNIEYHQLDISKIPTEYINIQSYASKALNCLKGNSIGLGNASSLLEISIERKFHDAFNDAYYTSEVFRKIYSKEIKTNIYIPYKNTKLQRSDAKKHKIDTDSLIKQFEKMFNREMTAEDTSIIQLAYIMGKTNQFQVSTIENK